MRRNESVVIVEGPCDVEETSKPFGKRWGQTEVVLTSEHVRALQAGKCIAVDVRDEYVVFLHLGRGDASKQMTRARGRAKEMV
jgi:hypothetical protein